MTSRASSMCRGPSLEGNWGPRGTERPVSCRNDAGEWSQSRTLRIFQDMLSILSLIPRLFGNHSVTVDRGMAWSGLVSRDHCAIWVGQVGIRWSAHFFRGDCLSPVKSCGSLTWSGGDGQLGECCRRYDGKTWCVGGWVGGGLQGGALREE